MIMMIFRKNIKNLKFGWVKSLGVMQEVSHSQNIC